MKPSVNYLRKQELEELFAYWEKNGGIATWLNVSLFSYADLALDLDDNETKIRYQASLMPVSPILGQLIWPKSWLNFLYESAFEAGLSRFALCIDDGLAAVALNAPTPTLRTPGVQPTISIVVREILEVITSQCRGALLERLGSRLMDSRTGWLQDPRLAYSGLEAYSACSHLSGLTTTDGLGWQLKRFVTDQQVFGAPAFDAQHRFVMIINYAQSLLIASRNLDTFSSDVTAIEEFASRQLGDRDAVSDSSAFASLLNQFDEIFVGLSQEAELRSSARSAVKHSRQLLQPTTMTSDEQESVGSYSLEMS
jgi:hypothetical protein